MSRLQEVEKRRKLATGTATEDERRQWELDDAVTGPTVRKHDHYAPAKYKHWKQTPVKKQEHFVYGLLRKNVTGVAHFGVGSGNKKRVLGQMRASGSVYLVIFADHLPKNIARNVLLYLKRHYRPIE